MDQHVGSHRCCFLLIQELCLDALMLALGQPQLVELGRSRVLPGKGEQPPGPDLPRRAIAAEW